MTRIILILYGYLYSDNQTTSFYQIQLIKTIHVIHVICVIRVIRDSDNLQKLDTPLHLDIFCKTGYHIVSNMFNLQDKPSHQKEAFMKHRYNFLWTFPSVAIALLLLFYTIKPRTCANHPPCRRYCRKSVSSDGRLGDEDYSLNKII